MDFNKFNKIFQNEPSYRLRQASKALFSDLIVNWDKATALPIKLRNKLNQQCSLDVSSEVFQSSDNQTTKFLISLSDGAKIESVLMRSRDSRYTICISTQVGCALCCSFCATGKMGFMRNLTPFEIILQVLVCQRYFKENKLNQRIHNVVLMGMGEPFLNYDNMMDAVRLINSPDGSGIGARRISISTAGIVPGILKLAKENLQVNLAISLHAPNNRLRSSLMPVNNAYSLDQVFQAVEQYIKITNRKVMFEYLMIAGINDTEDCARELTKLFKNKKLYMINLISYNQTGVYSPSALSQINKFQSILEHNRINVTRRYSFGQDINAACGQLAGKN